MGLRVLFGVALILALFRLLYMPTCRGYTYGPDGNSFYCDILCLSERVILLRLLLILSIYWIDTLFSFFPATISFSFCYKFPVYHIGLPSSSWMGSVWWRPLRWGLARSWVCWLKHYCNVKFQTLQLYFLLSLFASSN